MRRAALWASVIVAVLIVWWAGRPPAPVPAASAPETAFSAERAFSTVQAIARAPHPTGSAEAARVRGEIAARLRAMGMDVLVRPGVGMDQVRWAGRGLAAAHVENIVGVLPGRDRSLPALALMSHSDSVPSSPGAADDAAGVAASLEIVRAIAAAGPPLRDVMVVVTDGEEAGLLGAEAFFTTDPLAKRIGAVINLETRGSSGRAQMFETAPDAGGWVRLFGRTAKGATANALMPFVYHRMPNGTDFTKAFQAGVPGLNISFSGRQFDYHSAHITPAALDRGSLQSMGDQALGPARRLATTRALPEPAPDPVYGNPVVSQLFGAPALIYPPAVGWALVLVEAALFAGAAWLAWTQARASVGGIAFGALTLVVMTLAAGFGLHLLTGPFGNAYGDIQQRYAVLGRYPWALGAAALIAGALALAVLRAARTRAGVWSLWVGALGVVLLLAVVAQIAAHVTAFAFAWPLLPTLAAALIALLLGGDLARAGPLLTVAVLAALGLSEAFGWGGAIFSAVGVDMPAALAVAVPLSAILLIPLAAGEGRLSGAWTPTVMLTLGLIALAAAAGSRPGTVDRPALTQAMYFAEPGTNRFERVSALGHIDAWSRAALTADGGRISHAPKPPFIQYAAFSAPARPVALTPPTIILERVGARGVLRVRPTRGGRELRVRVQSGAALTDVTLQGRPVKLLQQAGRWSAFSFAAPPPEGVTLSFGPPPPGTRFDVAALEIADGWPPGARVPPRPKTLQPWGWSDTTQVIARAALAW